MKPKTKPVNAWAVEILHQGKWLLWGSFKLGGYIFDSPAYWMIFRTKEAALIKARMAREMHSRVRVARVQLYISIEGTTKK